MTPANPDNSKPFIYRIADALGITHLVVAVQHSHLMSEITGLVDALAAKAPLSHTHRTIQNGTYAVTLDDDGEVNVGCTSVVITMPGISVDIELLPSNAANLLRALTNPDSTPTTNSDNLVTSGGVAAALAGKMDNKTIDSTPTENSTNLVTSGGVKDALNGKNYLAGQTVSFIINGNEVEIEQADIPNLLRALADPDSTPTANSDKLVTSGGVKAALNQKVDLSKFSEEVDRLDLFMTSDVDEKINLQNVFDDDHYSTTYIIENYTSEDRTLDSFFNEGSAFLVCEPNKIIHPDSYVIAKVIRYNGGSNILFFVVVEGIYEM